MTERVARLADPRSPGAALTGPLRDAVSGHQHLVSAPDRRLVHHRPERLWSRRLRLSARAARRRFPRPTLETFRTDDAPCYDRSAQPETSVVDTHVHLRPFGGQAIPFEEVMQFFAETGVLFANVYGIGQMLPASSACTYYLDCPGTLVVPTLKNDFVNAANFVTKAPAGVHLTLSMSFPDLARPESILPGMALLEEEYPGVFTWMGEVNLVKQALFDNGRAPVPVAAIGEWAAFMDVLRERGIPLAIHSDLGNNDNPTRYVPLMEEVMRLYPEIRLSGCTWGCPGNSPTWTPPSTWS